MNNIGKLIYASSERCADLLYLTGFQAEDPFFYFKNGDSETMIVSELELGRAKKQRRENVKVVSYSQALELFGVSSFSPQNIVSGLANSLKINEWNVNEDFPLGLAENVRKLLPEITFIPLEEFCPERNVKNAKEIELIRKAEQVAEKALAKGIEMIANATVANDGLLLLNGEPLTSELLHGEVNAELVRNGGFSTSTIIAPGVQAADPHQAGFGPIYANQPIVFDIFPRTTSGYFGDLSRTVLKGNAPEIVAKAFDAVKDAQRRVIDALKPGMTGIEAHTMAANILESHGFKTDRRAETPYGFFHGLGHGVGLEIHEEPCLNTRNDKPLAAGNVVTVEPGLYYPEWGGIRIEDIVAITDTSSNDLTSAPIFLEIE